MAGNVEHIAQISDTRYEISDVVSPSGMILKITCHCEPVRRLVWQSPKVLDRFRGWDAIPSPGGKGDREAVDEEWRHLILRNADKSNGTDFPNVPF